MRTVIAYDVSSDRARTRLVRTLSQHATRVQASVFEAPHLSPADYARLRPLLERELCRLDDRIRYYRLCATCGDRIESYGMGPALIALPKPFIIV